MNEYFETAFGEVEQHVQATSNGQVSRDIVLTFGGETPGQAIEGMAEWSAANDRQDLPFIIESLRLKDTCDSIPKFLVVVTVSDWR
ncbi:hypothetical protein [Streptomyces sp. NPDC048272]|uniref:hypothetical protein n=1 Tax=Streptomyces sp. NPDC048272 TaxID=3154616 RepID=UPI003436585D